MARTCAVCGNGKTREQGTPMYYEAIDGYAHPECARKEGFNKGT